MNVLVTGGQGRMARHLKSTDKVNYFLPGREDLNLEFINSIDEYIEGKDIQGLVLNAFKYVPGDVSLDNFSVIQEEFLKATQVNLLGTLYLHLKLKHSLKFIIFLSTGLDPKTELSQIYYRNSKLSIIDLLERISYVDTEIKTILVHPGHMHDDYTFKQSALQITKMIENLDEFKHFGHYGIFDKDKMEYKELESLSSYHSTTMIRL